MIPSPETPSELGVYVAVGGALVLGAVFAVLEMVGGRTQREQRETPLEDDGKWDLEALAGRRERG